MQLRDQEAVLVFAPVLTDHLLFEEFCISFCRDLRISEQILDLVPWDNPL